MGIKRKEQLHQVVDKTGKSVYTLYPITLNTRREIVQNLLRGNTINRGPTNEEQEIANSLDIKKRSKMHELQEQNAVNKCKLFTLEVKMLTSTQAPKLSPLEECLNAFDLQLFARTHTLGFIPPKSAVSGSYDSHDMGEIIARAQAMHELHLKHQAEGLPPPRF